MSGSPRRSLCEHYGRYATCLSRFVLWRIAGVWDLSFAAISRRSDAEGELTTKILTVIDAKDLPLTLVLAPGHQPDSLVH